MLFWLCLPFVVGAQCDQAFEGSLDVSGGIWTVDVGWSIVSSDGVVVVAGATGQFSLCLPADCYTLELTDSAGDGWTGTTYSLTDAAGVVLYEGSLNDATEGDGESFGLDYIPLLASGCGVGCLDEVACNYDPLATLQGGICDYSCIGCSDPAACNYDPLVTVAVGS